MSPAPELEIAPLAWNDSLSPEDRAKCLALMADADPSPANVEDYLRRGELYIARSAGEIVGLHVILETRPRTVEIMNVAVAPELQGRGIGKRLVAHAIERARAKQAKTVEIGTANSSVGQLALYQKAGFRIVGIDPDYFSRFYEATMHENGIRVRDMIRLAQDL